MKIQSINNMSSDFSIYQAFSAAKGGNTETDKRYLQEQIAWTEERIAQLQQRLDQLECALEYQPN